jgi:hypothetical protein
MQPVEEFLAAYEAQIKRGLERFPLTDEGKIDDGEDAAAVTPWNSNGHLGSKQSVPTAHGSA